MGIFIEIWSDILCPFCYIGKRNLESALEEFPDPVQIVWRSFELNKEAPKKSGDTLPEALAKKYGKSLEWALDMNQQIQKRALDVGLTLNFEKVVPTNSFDAHRLIHLAEKSGRQGDMNEALFHAYFTDGQDISDHSTLIALGVSLGLDSNEIRVMLESDRFRDEVREDQRIATDLEISGVPFFVVNQRFAISGAQPKEFFVESLTKIKTELAKTEG